MKTRQIVIFGTGDMAELADFYFSNDSAYEVAGFAVDAAFMKQEEFRGRPVAPFEDVETKISAGPLRLLCRRRLFQDQRDSC